MNIYVIYFKYFLVSIEIFLSSKFMLFALILILGEKKCKKIFITIWMSCKQIIFGNSSIEVIM